MQRDNETTVPAVEGVPITLGGREYKMKFGNRACVLASKHGISGIDVERSAWTVAVWCWAMIGGANSGFAGPEDIPIPIAEEVDGLDSEQFTALVMSALELGKSKTEEPQPPNSNSGHSSDTTPESVTAITSS